MGCSHLRFTWQVLTVVTVLGVALQLLGVVRPYWNTKLIGPADEQSGIRHLPAESQLMLQSVPSSLDLQQRVYHFFQWKNSRTLDTTPVRHLISTTRRILMPNEYKPARGASLPKTPKKEPWVHLDQTRQLPSQNENLLRRLPEVPSKSDLSTHSLSQNKNTERESTGIASELGASPKMPARSPAQNQNMPRKSPEVPSKRLPSNSYGINSNSDRQAVNVLSHDESGRCLPKDHVVFLKTHKTASSTILNVLYRYGDTRNLTFALPVNMHSQLFYPYFFMSHFVEGVRFRRVTKFHIMCNHMRFQGPEVRKMMPVDSFYFSILRNPVSMMESIFTYYKSIPAFENFQTLTAFLLDGGRSYDASLLNNHYARNILTFDFGLDNSAPANDMELDERADTLIATVESNFHLILISEYFDESMILLKHSLCWSLEDVVSFRLNSRSETSRSKLSPDLEELVKKWNSLDWRLYLYFNATFWRHIDTTLGRAKLQEEVQLLRAKRAELKQTCLQGGGAVNPDKIQDESLKPFQYGRAIIQGYNICPGLDKATHSLCQKLVTPELQYTSTLYAKQFPDLAGKHQITTKMASSKRSSTIRHAVATTRHSANINSALQSRTVQDRNSQRNVNIHQQKLEKTFTKHSIVSSIANSVGVAQKTVEIEPDPDKPSAVQPNILTKT